jgi:putative oxidoreductase
MNQSDDSQGEKMRTIFKTAQNHSKFENAIECIRIYLGIALFFKGIHFMINPQDLVYFLQQGQLNILETFISHYIISAHLVGGLLMSVGLLTRVGALIQLPILSGALVIVHSKEALFSINQNIELTALVLFLLVIYAIIGSGNLSIDHHIVEDETGKKVWIEEFVKKIFSTDGALTLVRFSSKIRKKPDIKSRFDFNQSLFDHQSKLRKRKSLKKK